MHPVLANSPQIEQKEKELPVAEIYGGQGGGLEHPHFSMWGGKAAPLLAKVYN